MTKIVVPFPVSVNRLYIKGRGKRSKTLSQSGRRYYRLIAAYLKGKLGPVDYPLRVTMWLFPENNHRRDASNYSKSLWDAMVKAEIWLDDSQIKDERYIMGAKTKHPCAVIEFTPCIDEKPMLQDVLGRELTEQEQTHFTQWVTTMKVLNK